jgi:hypothetical protein
LSARLFPTLTAALTSLWLVAVPLEAGSPAHAQDSAKITKIVFLAGPKEHGAPGRHEYEKDLKELAWGLEHASNLKNVKTVVLVGKAPKDFKRFRGCFGYRD